MAFRTVDQALYDALLAGFRLKPGNATFAAEQAGCDRRLAMKIWQAGWSARGIKFDPISVVLSREQAQALADASTAVARKALADAKLREEARDAAIKARSDMGSLLLGASGVQASFALSLNKLGPAIMKIVESINATVNSSADQITLAQKLRIVRDFARACAMLQQSNRDHQVAIQTHFGDPAEYIGLVNGEEVSPAEMVAEIQAAARNAERFAAKNGLRLIAANGAVVPGAVVSTNGNGSGQPH